MEVRSLRGFAAVFSVLMLLTGVAAPQVGFAGSGESSLMPADLGAAVSEVQHGIQSEEGHFTAVNQRNQLVLAFDGQGVEVAPSAAEPGWRWGLRLEGYGSPRRIEPVEKAEVAANGRRLEYRRGPVTEWYENRDVGVEQGFTLARPPRSGGSAIELRLGTHGGLDVVLGKDGKSAEFRDASGRRVLDYRDLSVVDARGKALPSRLKQDGGQLTIAVDTRGAAWPVVVDPLIVRQEATLTAPDYERYMQFGQSVAVSGDTAVVGAPFDTILGKKQAGSAYVFIRKGAVWSLQGKLTSGDDTEMAFGWSAAIDGDTLVVGAPGDFQGIRPDNPPFGAAYVFKRIGTRWLQKGKLTAANKVRNSRFGRSVSISGDTVAAVASGNGGNTTYVFVKHDGEEWTDQTETAKFGGGSVAALSGETLAVGVPDEGVVRVYVKPEGGWTDAVRPVVLRASDLDGIFEYFGADIGISGNTIVSGAVFAGNEHEGAVYVFERPVGGWVDATQTAKLTASDTNWGELGTAVAISGDTIVATSPRTNSGALGAAFFYTKPSGGWVNGTETVKELNTENCFFGLKAALAGNSAVVSCNGRAYVYRLHTLPSQVPPLPPGPGAQRKKLNVIVKGLGTVTSNPKGIDNCDSVCSFEYADGTGVNLTAEPEDGYMFSHWINGGGRDCYGRGTCWLLLDRNRTVAAKFIKVPEVKQKH